MMNGTLRQCDGALGQETVPGPHRERVRFGPSGPTLGVGARLLLQAGNTAEEEADPTDTTQG